MPGLIPTGVYQVGQKEIENVIIRNFLPRFRREMRIARDFVGSCANDARATVQEARAVGADPPPANSFVGVVVGNEGLPGTETLPDWELQDECIGFLIALKGQESLATALEWGVKFLADHPVVQQRLRAELLQLPNYPDSRAITYVDVCGDATPYLEAVVSEILRCAPPSPGDTRYILEPIQLLGYKVPAHTQIIFDPWAMARRATKGNLGKMRALDPLRSQASLKAGFSGHGLWDDEDVLLFEPERWLDSDGAFMPKSGFSFPFGMGPRSCPGRKLAARIASGRFT